MSLASAIEPPSEAKASVPQLSPYFITTENARKMQERGTETRREKKRQKLLMQEDTFRNERLFQVREQLRKVDAMIRTETDPQRLDRLASAQARLSAQEFALAGRPMPGAFRPVKERAKKESSGSLVPLGVSNAA